MISVWAAVLRARVPEFGPRYEITKSWILPLFRLEDLRSVRSKATTTPANCSRGS